MDYYINLRIRTRLKFGAGEVRLPFRVARRAFTAIALLAACGCALGIAATAPAGGRPLSVVLVFDAGTKPTENDALGQGYRGFLTAVKRYHVQGRVATVDPQQNPTGLLYSLARQRYDLIIAGVVGPDIVDSAAQRFPKSRFLMPDDSYAALGHRLRNVEGTRFHSEQPAYLAGFLAALVARNQGKNTVSTVGGYKFPPVDQFIAGFRAGARAAVPGIRTLNAYTGDFLDPSKCKSIALSQIANGSAVVFPVAGACSAGAIEAAKEKGVFAVGVDVDQSHLGPHILTSVLKRTDWPMLEGIRRLTTGAFSTGGDIVYDLHNGGTGLGAFSPRVPKPLIHRLDAVRRAIVAGKVTIPSVVK